MCKDVSANQLALVEIGQCQVLGEVVIERLDAKEIPLAWNTHTGPYIVALRTTLLPIRDALRIVCVPGHRRSANSNLIGAGVWLGRHNVLARLLRTR